MKPEGFDFRISYPSFISKFNQRVPAVVIYYLASALTITERKKFHHYRPFQAFIEKVYVHVTHCNIDKDPRFGQFGPDCIETGELNLC